MVLAAAPQSRGPAKGLRGSWERLLETWERPGPKRGKERAAAAPRLPAAPRRYREDVTRWHAMIFQVFAKGGSFCDV